MLLVLGCAEPTATLSRAAAPTTVEPQLGNSYYVNASNRTVYVRINSVRADDERPIHTFIRGMFESADSASARRLVVDLRSITGGDTRLLVPLIRGVVMRERFAHGGGLYVVVGPDSFSPAQNAARLLQQYAHPVVVQEAP
jgi:C-terminal processing protease CtpA/Prc